jgi:hypothetical protein
MKVEVGFILGAGAELLDSIRLVKILRQRETCDKDKGNYVVGRAVEAAGPRCRIVAFLSDAIFSSTSSRLLFLRLHLTTHMHDMKN